MKIVVFSINPIFPDVITGGASKHLYHITRSLGQAGHDVRLLCAQGRPDHPAFNWAERVEVLPVLPFHLPFPQPYAISGADMGMIIERVSTELEHADRFYIHDGEFLFSEVYDHVPTVASFRDNIYPESVLGSFLGKADEVICVSGYSAAVIKSTAGRFFAGLKERIHQVNNGIDFDVFKPVNPNRLAKKFGVDPQTDRILLHPHRPEQGKGLAETIKVVGQLVHHYGQKRLKVLVPEWIETMVSSDEASFYQQMTRLMDELDIRDNVIFIPWLPQDQMPELYSLGQATLCLGNFIEAFGNVAYESLACGTPSVVARVGVHRTLLPDELIDKVNYGDIPAAAEQIMAILDGDIKDQAAVLKYLKATMDIDQQLTAYREIITGCVKRERLQFSAASVDEQQSYTLAPWCYMDGERLYHDYRGTYEQDAELAGLLRKSSAVSRGVAIDAGISEQRWDAWLARTWLVPVESIL
jgi:glycosyltransferase involved in cell wall biosynthesis